MYDKIHKKKNKNTRSENKKIILGYIFLLWNWTAETQEESSEWALGWIDNHSVSFRTKSTLLFVVYNGASIFFLKMSLSEETRVWILSLTTCIKLTKPLSLSKHQFTSVQFSRSVMSNSLQPHESQHARPPCPSPTPGVHSNSCPLSQ